eukprot:TRINITY_DN948_c0_g1_i2.p1 TRINITY_DN948_c0_g1~~TRINITY_DN948_c0_g1_i2.p1  ORF type:complete len:420 (-),score=149.14 TRINITY_DN948_c0_g1_i2:45-1160(-)
MSDLEDPIVIDNGSGVVKAGFAGEAYPCVTFPSVIGLPKPYENIEYDKKVYVGDEVENLQGALLVKYPLGHGKVEHWEYMEAIWDLTFEKLDVDPSDHPMLLTEPPLNPLKNRERMTEIMFETYKAPALYVAIQAVLALYAAGRTTGVVLDSGDGVSHTVPVYEGFSLQHAICRLDIAGRDITEYLARLLLNRNLSFSTSAELQIVRNIKEKHAFVLPERMEVATIPSKKELRRKFELPSGEQVTVGEERFQCSEVLFDPAKIGKEAPGIQDIIYMSIQKSPIDIRKDLYYNIVLSGGTTMIPGIADRLHAELTSLSLPATKIKVVAPPERKFSVWIGGAVLSDLRTFRHMWITSDEYHEIGPHIVHRKCF